MKKNIYKTLTALFILIITLNFKTYAVENFVDNNAISKLAENNKNSKIIISEYNTGKIISQKNESVATPYSRLINKIVVFSLSEKLRDKNITFDDKIQLTKTDDVLEKYKIKDNITVKDAIFLLEQSNSSAVLESSIKYLDLNIDNIQKILDKLTMNETELTKLEISEENKSTAKNINYLVTETIHNYPEILELTKSPEYKFSNDEKEDNNIEFIKSENIRTLGINFNNDTASLISYSGNTRIVITIIGIEEKKEDFFKTNQSLLEYIFQNYTYKLALKAGKYDINNENITIEDDIYDLFYKEHSEKDVRYFLMNNKILLFQNYNYLSANSGTVYANFKSNTNNSNYSKAKETFIQDAKFHTKTNKEKVDILIDRTQYFATFVVLIYSLIFIIIYILKRILRKGK